MPHGVKGDARGENKEWEGAYDVRGAIDRIFNKQINGCKSASSVCTLVLLGENLQNLNAIHTSNAIDTLGKRLSEQGVDTVDTRKVSIFPFRSQTRPQADVGAARMPLRCFARCCCARLTLHAAAERGRHTADRRDR